MKKSKQNKTTVQSKHLWQKYPELFILLGIVLILVLLTKGIVWYQTEQHAQTIRKDRERFEAVVKSMEGLTTTLSSNTSQLGKPKMLKNCHAAGIKFEPNPERSCTITIKFEVPVLSSNDVRNSVDKYNQLIKSTFNFIPSGEAVYPDLSQGVGVSSDELHNVNLKETYGYGGGTFTHQSTGMPCRLIYKILNKSSVASLSTEFWCQDKALESYY